MAAELNVAVGLLIRVKKVSHNLKAKHITLCSKPVINTAIEQLKYGPGSAVNVGDL